MKDYASVCHSEKQTHFSTIYFFFKPDLYNPLYTVFPSIKHKALVAHQTLFYLEIIHSKLDQVVVILFSIVILHGVNRH